MGQEEPSLLTFTMMKNEGPFILEWVAWQRLLGVDRIIVLSNDCDDGTDDILDQLDRMGIVNHIPNPIQVAQNSAAKPQAMGFSFGRMLREWRDADYVMLCDVDEFPCLRGGHHSLKALMKDMDYPEVLTMCETIFGTGEVHAFEDQPLAEQFHRSSSLSPGKYRSRRGFKSICRNDPRLLIRNHRPRVPPKHAAKIRWLDGSGRDFPLDVRSRLQKGGDCRGTYDLVSLNHFALRSLESYMVKAARGQPMGGTLDARYFRTRNRTESENTDMLPHIPALKNEIRKLSRDTRLAELHEASVEAHREKIAHLKKTPLYKSLLELVRPAPADA